MREIKFRAWDTIHNEMSNTFSLLDCINQNQVFMLPENFKFMQYTGLKDKNGVEIYEGYILAWPEPYTVIFEDGTFCVAEGDRNLLFEVVDRGGEVIGNIYENPELLKLPGPD